MRDFAITRFYAIVVFCMLFPSCAKKQLPERPIDTNQASINNNLTVVLDTIAQQEAMLIDIPIPFYDERIIPSDYRVDSETLFFGYKSPLSRNEAIDFFMKQMERYGWQHLISFDAQEVLLQFQSPDRYCSVVIKSADNGSEGSSIFIYIKRAI